MLTIAPLKEIFRKYDFRPLKRLGENYLIDPNIKDKIIAEASLSPQDIVLEIGPGLGALTTDIARSGAGVFAVEKDKKAFSILDRMIAEEFPNLKLIQGDILEFDLQSIGVSKKIKVIGNLPYYITTPIIEYLIRNRGRISYAVIMVQKEFANRLLAGPGTEDYGSLSCFVAYYSKITHIHAVSRTSFYPEPDVDSSLIRLDLLDVPSVVVKDEGLLFKVIRGSFNQRRKSIINSLSRENVLNMPKEALSGLLTGLKIDPRIRPEMLGLSEFAKIADSL
ncbi:MAG: ribosomal RNA small subunit methyltransferase A [Candidatus Omnitrophica bacterium]|nr:ribosomal RNA small subunit methyltransferase A [Candidatus Omnitrophota bacterium]MBU1808852.1 ribosomal RNA small subunit methyltransferase A [Candidatus Omnitrophota bacterium]